MTTPIFTEELTYYADAGCLCVGDGAMKAFYMNNCGDMILIAADITSVYEII